MNRVCCGALLAIGGALVLTAPASAASGKATSQMRASVNVVGGCTVGVTPLTFSILVPANIDVDSTATLTMKCSPNTAYVIDIDNGLNAQGNNRRVKHSTGNAFLTYDIYKDPPRSQVWGKGNLKNVPGNSGLLGIVVYPIYGRLNATKSMIAGAYRDTLTITVTY